MKQCLHLQSVAKISRHSVLSLFIDIISLCLLIGQIKMLACLLSNGGLSISGWIGQLSCLTIFSTSLSVAAFLRRAGGSMLESTGSHGRGVGQQWHTCNNRPSNNNKKCDGSLSLVYYLHLHCATDKYICMIIEELTAKIRPCECKKLQFILIGKLDNISIKLVA